MTGYARKFDDNATVSFRVNDKQLLKNYNKIWEKIDKYWTLLYGSCKQKIKNFFFFCNT